VSEVAGIKLDNVASDTFGVSGRLMHSATATLRSCGYLAVGGSFSGR
jgi:hypothetical protein